MPRGESSVNHKVGALQRLLTVERFLKIEVDTQFLRQAAAHMVGPFQSFQVDVHKADRTAFEAAGETKIADQRERERTAAGADQADFNVILTSKSILVARAGWVERGL